MSTDASAKKDIQKLQRAIVDGLEDVKAQDIQVFNTEHLSPLFERVIVASGSSNRQTKALAASVREAVKEAGFNKPRIEGEDNGEWIIVDCGPAVAHIMQPNIRAYYHLEEIWGDKPVRVKFGAPKPSARVSSDESPAPAKKAPRKRAGASGGAEPAASSARKPAAKKAASRPAAPKAPASKAPARKSAGSVAAKSARKPAAKKVAPKKVVVGAPGGKVASKKVPARKKA
ncbi:ribosome silencing factor [Pseudacidovorax sp. RU35E]|jgi:ribosome-associated protein|uniref:ribosome silencing factor n=1 Tax=Pseudacidovorax sp. RU35E TaxID=1907403 RepID=UPI0009559BE3|nr:ribosome silencing factor [Pseudacidovorax sp. RU35E]SIR29775.1 ribosome-associated protein [Pseudacidovorax sp. RU35E]